MNPEEMNEKQLLQEILKWTKFAGMNQVKTVLEAHLDTDVDKLIYQRSDGTRGIVEMGNLVGLSKNTIDRLWESWVKIGLGENIPVKGGSRFKRAFSLNEFGIKVPETIGNREQEDVQPTLKNGAV